jgi:hypothetical protein
MDLVDGVILQVRDPEGRRKKIDYVPGLPEYLRKQGHDFMFNIDKQEMSTPRKRPKVAPTAMAEPVTTAVSEPIKIERDIKRERFFADQLAGESSFNRTEDGKKVLEVRPFERELESELDRHKRNKGEFIIPTDYIDFLREIVKSPKEILNRGVLVDVIPESRYKKLLNKYFTIPK